MEITLEILKNRYSEKLNKLIEYGDMGLYEDTGIVAYEEALGIDKKYAKELLKMALDNDFNQLVHYEEESEDDLWADNEENPELDATYAPCHALIALSSLEIADGSQQIMDNFDNIDPFDDNYLFAFDYFFAGNYISNIELIRDIVLDKNASIEKRIRMFYIFEEVNKHFKDKKSLESIESISIELLESNERNAELNALALNMLVIINGVKHIEFIRECFRNKNIDGFYLESLEEIEIKLGLREEVVKVKEVSTVEDKNIEKKSLIEKSPVGRNDPCPCGSGKKYKKCCLNK